MFNLHLVSGVIQSRGIKLKRPKVKNNVRNIRRMLDVTQEELAKKANVTRQTIIAIEKQRYEPTISVVLALAKSLNEPVENIFFFDTGKNNIFKKE